MQYTDMKYSHSSTDARFPLVWKPEILISGGQTGADQGALYAAQALGIATGGIMPKGWRTETGPRPTFKEIFGVVESVDAGYGSRTRENVELCDALINIARNFDSPGTALTKEIAFRMKKPVFDVPFPILHSLESGSIIDDVRSWLRYHRPTVLMVAGNRESKAPGIQEWTEMFIIKLFSLK